MRAVRNSGPLRIPFVMLTFIFHSAAVNTNTVVCHCCALPWYFLQDQHTTENTPATRERRSRIGVALCSDTTMQKVCRIVLLIIESTILSGKRLITKEARRSRRYTSIPAFYAVQVGSVTVH